MSTTAEPSLASREGAELISGSFVTGRRAADECADADLRAVAAIRAKNREFHEKTEAQLACRSRSSPSSVIRPCGSSST